MRLWPEFLMGTEHWEDQGVDEMVFNLTLKAGLVYEGVKSIHMVSSCQHVNDPARSVKCKKILDYRNITSQDGHWSIELQ
jgi:hypothetical protein